MFRSAALPFIAPPSKAAAANYTTTAPPPPPGNVFTIDKPQEAAHSNKTPRGDLVQISRSHQITSWAPFGAAGGWGPRPHQRTPGGGWGMGGVDV